MKLLITSDVHGNHASLMDVISLHKDVDYHIDAGDMCFDMKRLERYHIVSVKGNNDFGSDLPYVRVLDFDGVKILLTHGHLEHVKFSLDRLKLKAKVNDVQICIFGHTHERYMMVDEGILYINPGALGDYHHSYAIYENQQVTFYNRS
ncbi:MAG: YfcE family phosphodiesterase [Firmicutes bacterium]|nr:YfcE family phosphodiesterase [Bacillota bacterium]